MDIPKGEQTGKCKRCGRCCFYKAMSSVGPVFTDKPCPYLCRSTMLCTVFENRFSSLVGCLTTEQAIKMRALPSDCPYVADVPGYVGPLSLEEFQERMKLLD